MNADHVCSVCLSASLPLLSSLPLYLPLPFPPVCMCVCAHACAGSVHCVFDRSSTTVPSPRNFSAKSHQLPLPATPLTLCLSVIYSIIYKSVSNCGIVLLIDSEDSNFHSATQDWKSTCAHLSESAPHPRAAARSRFRCRLKAHTSLPKTGLIKYLPTINITISIRIIIRSCQSGAEFCFRETKQFKLWQALPFFFTCFSLNWIIMWLFIRFLSA